MSAQLELNPVLMVAANLRPGGGQKCLLPLLVMLALACLPGRLNAQAVSLSVAAQTDQSVRIAWPMTAAGFALEQSPTVGAGAVWTPVVSAQIVEGNEQVVRVPVSASHQFFRLRQAQTFLTTIFETSPVNGEGGVAVTRETIVRLSAPLAPTAVVGNDRFYAEFGGRRILSRIHLSSDRRVLTLFYLEPLPASALIRVTLNGTGLKDASDLELDLDGDGALGGTARIDFQTLSITPVSQTAVRGRVFASELMPDATGAQTAVNRPLAGVTISVDGAEETLRTTTDALGNFTLQPAPAGRFFVQVDGRTAEGSQWPNGNYYPVVGKAWEAVAGRQDNLAGGTGEIYLPLIRSGTLRSVSLTEDTAVTFPVEVTEANPALAGVSITVPAGSLFDNGGTRGGRVGIAPVPPDRLPEPLPAGLDFPLVITVQTDGPSNFDRPVPVRFPNLPDPVTGQKLPPGAKSALWSFNHDTGDWEIQGPMTVTADGNFVESDPGYGIRQPGWHGSTQGTPATGPKRPPKNPCESASTKKIVDTVIDLGVAALKCAAEFSGVSDGIKKALSIVSEIKKLTDSIGKLRDDIRAGKDAGVAKNAMKSILSGKKIVLDAIEVIKQQSLFAKITKVAKCAETILGTIDSICGRFVTGGVGPCSSNVFVQLACIGIAEAKSILAIINRTTEAAEQGLTKNGIKITCGLIDLLATQLGIPVESPEGLHARLAALPDDAPVPPDIVDAIEQMALASEEMLADFQPFFEAIEATMAFQAKLEELQKNVANIQAGENGLPGKAHYLIEINGQMLRGLTDEGGLIRVILAPDSDYTLSIFDHAQGTLGVVTGRTARTGFPTEFPLPLFQPPDDLTDSDNDTLLDVFERIVGTDPAKPDTDGDGILDGAEVQQGTDPLEGVAARTGLVASVRLPGVAVDIGTTENLAILAARSAGVVVCNIFAGLNPSVIAQVDTPGDATAVAVSGNLVAVADGAAGLAIIDISDPPAARILHQIQLGSNAQGVTTAGSLAFVGLASGTVAMVDMETGSVLDQARLGSASIQDLTMVGNTLYALTVGKLSVLTLDETGLTLESTVDSPGVQGAGRRRLRLFAGGGLVYAVHTSGYNIFDAKDPGQPRLLRAVNTTQFGWKQLIANGSGLGLAAVSPNSTDDGPHHVSLYNVGPDGTGDAFLTTFETPGLAAAISISGGIAYVADSAAGLQVINYLAFDTLGQPPTIRLRTSFTDTAAEEGKPMLLLADALDDVQIRSVEFYVDGTRVAVDGAFPFEHRLVTPLITPDKTRFTVRARAFDTGGNSTWSEELTLVLQRDATPPTVRRTVPFAGALVGALRSVSAFFSEPISVDTIDASSVQLLAAGADGVVGTADDVPVAGDLDYREDVRGVFFRPAVPLPPGNYRLALRPPLADLVGNRLAAPVLVDFRVFDFIDEDMDGMPDELEPALGLDPTKADTDGDGILDGLEDFDNDGLPNAGEVFAGTDPRNPDTDGNGILDGAEDPDGDGLNNTREFFAGTNPLVADTDGDGWNDESEITGASNPLDPASIPRLLVSGGPGRLQLNLPRLTAGAGSGVTTARPVLSISLPAVTADLTGGVTVARPPLSIGVTARTEGLAGGVVVARPHLSLNLTGISEALKAGVTVARPPLTIRINP